MTDSPVADCLFCRIVAGEIPADIVKQTDQNCGVPRHRTGGANSCVGDPQGASH